MLLVWVAWLADLAAVFLADYYLLTYIHSRAPRMRSPRGLDLRKFANLSIWEILVIMWPYAHLSTPQGNQCEMSVWEPVTCVQLDNRHPYYGQLTAVRIWYLLTRVTWLYLRFRCQLVEVICFFKYSADHLLAFNWSQAQVYVFSHVSPLKLSIELRISLQWCKVYCLK